jgi:hypothetical protein
MAKAPPVPREQRSFAAQEHGSNDPTARLDSAHPEQRDQTTGAQSPQPGDADVNLQSQGRFGNIKQNLTPQWKTQDR